MVDTDQCTVGAAKARGEEWAVPGLPKTTKWELPPHTGAKHAIVREYLVRWFPIMTTVSEKLIYFDGFAGPGRYESGEDGSPLIALKALLEHSKLEDISRVVFVFVEQDRERHASLADELETLRASVGGWPSNVEVVHRHGSFVDEAGEIVRVLNEKGVTMAPTFALIDPFGFKGVPMSLIAELLKHPKCELLFNLIFNSVTRHVHNEKVEHHMLELLGGADTSSIRGLSGIARRDAIVKLYVEQLKTAVGFRFVQPFEMWNDRNRLSTVLIPCTRHATGFLKMKEAMWAVDPSGRFTFSDVEASAPRELTLFTDDLGPSYGELDRAIRFRFAGLQVGIETVETFVKEETRYLPSHLRKHVLIPLENDGDLTAENPNGRNRRQYPKGTVITFPPWC